MPAEGSIVVQAGVDGSGDAIVTLSVGGVMIALDVYGAMNLTDLIDKKIAQAILWHKLAHDPETSALAWADAAGAA